MSYYETQKGAGVVSSSVDYDQTMEKLAYHSNKERLDRLNTRNMQEPSSYLQHNR